MEKLSDHLWQPPLDYDKAYKELKKSLIGAIAVIIFIVLIYLLLIIFIGCFVIAGILLLLGKLDLAFWSAIVGGGSLSIAYIIVSIGVKLSEYLEKQTRKLEELCEENR
jgi:uncharacterized metal-binding protein